MGGVSQFAPQVAGVAIDRDVLPVLICNEYRRGSKVDRLAEQSRLYEWLSDAHPTANLSRFSKLMQ